MPFLLIIVWVVVFGAVSAGMAGVARRPVAAWAVYGAILGPVALLLLHVAPPGHCRRCEAPVRGWGFVCRFCGEDVRGVPAPRRVIAPMATPAAGSDAPQVAPESDSTRPGNATSDPRTAAGTVERLSANTRSVERSTAVSGAGSTSLAATRATPPARPVPVNPRTSVASTPRPAAAEGGGRRRRGRETADPGRVLGGGLFLTGSASLLPGYRYAIAVTSTRLRILGPLNIEPEKVVMDRDLASFDAVVTEDRVMLTEGSPDRPRMFLVFEAVSGTSPADLVDEIVRAVQAVPKAG